jgi:cell division protein ZapB
MTDMNLKSLEDKVDALIQLYSATKRENQLLKDNEKRWQSERNQLLDKNEVARVRLEKVLQRLKTLQQE